HQLGQVVLHHVTDSAGLLIIGAAVFNAEIFRDCNLDALHRIPIPQGFEYWIGKTKRQQILYRLFAQVMIDAIDLGFIEVTVQERIQCASGPEVMPEWLFKDDTHPAMTLEESGPIEVFNRCRHCCGREREIEHTVLRQISGDLQPAYECGEGLEIFRTPFVNRLVVKMIFTPW